MRYTLDCAQLLGLWSVVRLFGAIREAEDPTIRSEILTEAQIRLTALVMELEPLSVERAGSARQALASA